MNTDFLPDVSEIHTDILKFIIANYQIWKHK